MFLLFFIDIVKSTLFIFNHVVNYLLNAVLVNSEYMKFKHLVPDVSCTGVSCAETCCKTK